MPNDHKPQPETAQRERDVWFAENSAAQATLGRVRELLADLDEEVQELRADVPPVGPGRVAHMYRTAGLSDARDRLRMALTTAGGKR